MIDRARLQTPQGDGSTLAEPPLSEFARHLQANRRLFQTHAPTILGRPLAELRRQTADELRRAAVDYLQQAGEPLPVTSTAPLLITGHQPELFHPGVWIKNFALDRLARSHGFFPLNLIVDNDIVKSTSISVPVRPAAVDRLVQLLKVPFDTGTGETSWEEHLVRDESLFAGFAGRVLEALKSWGYRPIIEDFWFEVIRHRSRTPVVGERIAAARRVFECRWGCVNAELPVSQMCRLESFAWFACGLLASVERFHSCYNQAVQQYRCRHGVRSRQHPVPDLARDGEWYELPLWGWRAGQPRGKLWARPGPDRIELRAGNDPWEAITDLKGNPAAAVRQWRDRELAGFKVRPRALTLTLFARLFAAELFIHGIGGGKYDEVTDAILRSYHGIEPPAFLVLSATLHLPLPTYPVSQSQLQQLRRRIRDLHYKPQQYVLNLEPDRRDEKAVSLVQQKLDWIGRQPANRCQRRLRFRTLRDLNEQLWPYVSDAERETLEETIEVAAKLEANQILQGREYAFCLFPEEKLRELPSLLFGDS